MLASQVEVDDPEPHAAFRNQLWRFSSALFDGRCGASGRLKTSTQKRGRRVGHPILDGQRRAAPEPLARCDVVLALLAPHFRKK